jgi:hypothetical protein
VRRQQLNLDASVLIEALGAGYIEATAEQEKLRCQ